MDNISFQVDKGSVYGYLEPNGAGRAPTIRIMLGLLKPVKVKSTLITSERAKRI